MSQSKLLAVFCYDVGKDRIRTKVAKLLEADAARVQESVFEGWMSERRATALGERIGLLIDSGDSLRVYLLSTDQALRTRTYGLGVPVEADDFHLF